MARTTFTDRSLKALRPAAAGQRYDLHDAVVPGLGVRVSDRSKKFFLVCRFPAKHQLDPPVDGRVSGAAACRCQRPGA